MRSIFFAFTALVFYSSTAFGQVETKILDGFRIEKLYDVPSEQGSWVSITDDPSGRLITCDQYGKLYRITLGDGKVQKVEPINVATGRAHGLLYAFDSLYVMSHAGEGQPAGLYRVLDSNGDDQFDQVMLLRKFNGGGEHGPHAVILSPDKQSLYICAGNHTDIPNPEKSRVPRNWQEDQVLPRMWDAGGHAVGKLAPGGWICKTDPDGKEFELISCGYRNQYDIAFDPNGELFTYDADMEWDIGLPWYRPTRVCHAVSGSEFGWRSGTGKWPVYYPDSLPSVVDIGPGSPTGIAFGTGAKFPAKYQNALFISDWSYGVIYAVHMQPDGASYKAESEIFCTAPGLAVTDMIVNSTDGAMYFMIGGRRSRSSLYKVTYGGSESTDAATFPELNEMAKLRRSIEELHVNAGDNAEASIGKVWPLLSHKDRHVRYAARTVLEHQSTDKWIQKSGSSENEQEMLEFALAAARSGTSNRDQLLEMLSSLNWQELDESQKLHALRVYGLILARMPLDQPSAQKIADKLSPMFPSDSKLVNRELSKVLIRINDTTAASKTMELLRQASTQEEQIDFVLSLRALRSGWTPELRQEYFQWFQDALKFKGGNSFSRFLQNIRNEAVATLSEQEKVALNALISQPLKPLDPYADLKARPLVKNWTMTDLAALDENSLADRDLENGRTMFAVGQCYKCHRIEGDGGIVGPDLNGAGRRFGVKDLLETLIDPSKEVSDQYQATTFLMEDGKTITGRIANLNGQNYMVQTNMLEPGNFTRIVVNQIEAMKPSKVSMMPTGLLDSMTEDDIKDLLAYMRSVGQPASE